MVEAVEVVENFQVDLVAEDHHSVVGVVEAEVGKSEDSDDTNDDNNNNNNNDDDNNNSHDSDDDVQ